MCWVLVVSGLLFIFLVSRVVWFMMMDSGLFSLWVMLVSRLFMVVSFLFWCRVLCWCLILFLVVLCLDRLKREVV